VVEEFGQSRAHFGIVGCVGQLLSVSMRLKASGEPSVRELDVAVRSMRKRISRKRGASPGRGIHFPALFVGRNLFRVDSKSDWAEWNPRSQIGTWGPCFFGIVRNGRLSGREGESCRSSSGSGRVLPAPK